MPFATLRVLFSSLSSATAWPESTDSRQRVLAKVNDSPAPRPGIENDWAPIGSPCARFSALIWKAPAAPRLRAHCELLSVGGPVGPVAHQGHRPVAVIPGSRILY